MTNEVITTMGQLISTVGFPVFVAVFMLYKTSKDSEEMRSAINELKNAIDKLTIEFRHHKGDDDDEKN